MHFSDDIIVTIRTITYNHEAYIRQCLEGLVMQQTNFRFECIVHDDASTDGTADIVREYAEKYPHLIKAIIQTENQYSKRDGTIARVLSAETRGQYIAWCEGDDYWTDPLKLQKQVDFLEANPAYCMCHTGAIGIKEGQEKERNLHSHCKTFDDYQKIGQIDTLIHNCAICTLTACMRTEAHNQYREDIQPQIHKWKAGDYPMWLWASIHSKIYCIPDITASYRILEESASHSKNLTTQIEFYKSINDIKIFFNDKYHLGYNSHAIRGEFVCSTLIQTLKEKRYNLLLRHLKIASQGNYRFLLSCGTWAAVLKRLKMTLSSLF